MQPHQPAPKPETAPPAPTHRQETPLLSSSAPSAQMRQSLGDPTAPLSPSHLMQLQKTVGNRAVAQLMKSRMPQVTPIQRQPNRTGLPDGLKTGLEQMSGVDLSDVQVHYNSDKPAQLSALAYAQGTDIHVAPGQERHLPHEGWHVVQQKQGRVQPTGEVGGMALNDHAGLEREADVMGAQANRWSGHSGVSAECPCDGCTGGAGVSAPAQRSIVLRKAVVQRAKLGKAADALSDKLSDIMNEFAPSDPLTADLKKLYAIIDKDQHGYIVKEELLRVSSAWDVPQLLPLIDEIPEKSIRAAYYPSGFDAAARTNRDTYVRTHPGATAGTWKCPGHNKPAHDRPTSDVTIDHVNPVAAHWNTAGYKSNKATRATWFNDTTNHVMLCRSCNSSKGSGGVYYTKLPEPANGFSH